MLARKLPARAGTAANRRIRLNKINCCNIVTLPTAGTLAKIKGIVRRTLPAYKAALCRNFLPVRCRRRIRCHRRNLLFSYFLHNTPILFLEHCFRFSELHCHILLFFHFISILATYGNFKIYRKKVRIMKALRVII